MNSNCSNKLSSTGLGKDAVSFIYVNNAPKWRAKVLAPLFIPANASSILRSLLFDHSSSVVITNNTTPII